MSELRQREIRAESPADVMAMVANTRATILAGSVAGAAVAAGFIASLVLITGLWGILEAFRFGMVVGLTGFVVLAALAGLLGFFYPGFPTTRFIAGSLVLTVAVIVAVSVYVSDVAILAEAARRALWTVGGAAVLIFRLWHLVLVGGLCGGLMALLQRRGLQQDVRWGLHFGSSLTLRTDPHVLLAVFGVPLVVMWAFAAEYYPTHSLAAIVFFSPFWAPSGFLFVYGWTLLARAALDTLVGQTAWFRQSIGLVHVLQGEDVLLLGAAFHGIRVDPTTGAARIRGKFRDAAQRQRVQEVALRVRGVTRVDVEEITQSAPVGVDHLSLAQRERLLAQRCPECGSPHESEELFCRACDSFVQNELVGKKANLLPRLLAAAIDAGIPAALILMFIIQPVTPWAVAHPLSWFWRFVFAPALYASFYVSVLHSGTTPGKALLGLEIIDLRDHRYPRLPQLLLRELGGKLMSALVLGIGFLWAFWDKNSQTWHDKLMRTIVVRNPDVW